MIHKYPHRDITVMCLHFHIDWCIIHPVDGVVKVVFLMWICICNTVSTKDNTTELIFPIVAFLKLIDEYLSTTSAFSILSPASIVC